MRIWQIILLLLVSHVIFAQGKYDANWVFGIKAGIDFSDTASPINFLTLCNEDNAAASISDSLGNLLFYVAPDSFFLYGLAENTPHAIYGRDNHIINNGDSLNVGYSLTGALFLPIPQTPNSYYLFYMNWDRFNNLLYATIVQDSNMQTYTVIKKNVLLNTSSLEWGIAAVRHANGNDWWILVHQSDSISPNNTFYEYLITKDSILGPYTQNIGSLHSSLDVSSGEINFSKTGNWLANALMSQNAVDLFNFNRCTGQLENYISIDTIDTTGNSEIASCEFSEDENYLYISEGGGEINSKSALYQLDLNSANISSSRKMLYSTDSAQTEFGNLLRAPNNKIYLAVEYLGGYPYINNRYNQFNSYLWVINNPDSFGAACNFQPYGYFLGDTLNDSARVYWGLPNMPNYNLSALSIYQGTGWDTAICNTDSITIGNPPAANVSYAWQRAKDITDTTLAQQTVKPDSSTWYYVTLTDTTINYSCQSVTDSFYVQVVNCCDSLLLSQCTLSKDTSVCANTNSGVILSVDTVQGISFVWQTAPGIINLHAIQQTVNPSQSTWYYVNFFSDSNSSLPCNQRVDSVLVQVINCCDSLLLSQCTLSKDTFICTNIDTPTKGAVLLVDTVPGVSFAWQPATGISVHSTEQIVDPSQSTWYYVTFFSDTDSSSACNQRKDSVYVEVKKCMVGIDEINSASQHLNIYPNPAQNIVTIEWSSNGASDANIVVYDVLGREVKKASLSGAFGMAQIDVSDLANGLYVVRVLSSSGGGVGGGKLTVIK